MYKRGTDTPMRYLKRTNWELFLLCSIRTGQLHSMILQSESSSDTNIDSQSCINHRCSISIASSIKSSNDSLCPYNDWFVHSHHRFHTNFYIQTYKTINTMIHSSNDTNHPILCYLDYAQVVCLNNISDWLLDLYVICSNGHKIWF